MQIPITQTKSMPLNLPPPTLTFHLFPTLPLELRIQIWEHSLPPPRLITLNRNHGRLQGTPSITLLWTCLESRNVALSRYTPWGPCTTPDLTAQPHNRSALTEKASPCPHSPLYDYEPTPVDTVASASLTPDSCLPYTYLDFEADFFVLEDLVFDERLGPTSAWMRRFVMARTAVLRIRKVVLTKWKLPPRTSEAELNSMEFVSRNWQLKFYGIHLIGNFTGLEEVWIVVGEEKKGRLVEVCEGDGTSESSWENLRGRGQDALNHVGREMQGRRMPVLKVGRFVVE